MNYSAAHYRDLANYDTLVLPLQASIAPLIGGWLEHWYIKQVICFTYQVVTRSVSKTSISTSAGMATLQVLPPRPVSPVGRPVRPTSDEFGLLLPPPPRRFSKLNISRRVRPVLLAVRAARATYFAAALAQYEQTLHRAADPYAAQAARLKQCAEYLLRLNPPLSSITTGQTSDTFLEREKLPSGQRYFFPVGWPVGKIASVLAEIQLFDKLHREFGANILAQPSATPAAPATTAPPQSGSPTPDKRRPHLGDTFDTAPPAALTVADLCRNGFTPDDVLALAREVGLADEAGRFCLWSRKPGTKPRKLGAVVGFCKALGGDAKGVTAPPLAGTIPERVQAVGVLLDVEIRTTKTGTGVAEKYRKATERALARRKPTH